jgi:enoyl-CoA hydratase
MAVTTETHGRVLVVRIERPEKRNAIDEATARGIDDALNRFQDDPELWAAVLTGTAALFCAGTDIVAGPGEPTARGGPYGVTRRSHTKPLVAAVEGLALGGGFEIAMACDLVVASTEASFGLPETRRGLVANSGALLRAMRCLPLNLARELLLTGTRLDARRAHEVGFVNRLAAPGHALEVALGLADEVCVSSPTAVSATPARPRGAVGGGGAGGVGGDRPGLRAHRARARQARGRRGLRAEAAPGLEQPHLTTRSVGATYDQGVTARADGDPLGLL